MRTQPLPKMGRSPQFAAHVYCGQKAGWINMPCGTEVGLGPSYIVLHGDLAPPPKKGAQPLIFGLCLSWLNGCMYQDTSWYRGRPHPRRHCVRCGPSSPPLKGHSPQFSANARCDQTAGCTKVPLGVEIALGPGDFVFNWDPALPQKKAQPTQFLAHVYCVQTAGWMKVPLGTKVDSAQATSC